MRSVKPILLLSFLLFASTLAEDFSEPLNNDVSNIEESDFDDDFGLEDYDDDENEDIIYSGMISNKKSPPPPPPSFGSILPSSSSFVKAPVPIQKSPIQINTCKRWRCQLNGYTPIWNSNAPSFCKDNYQKLSMDKKADCQKNFCYQVCASF